MIKRGNKLIKLTVSLCLSTIIAAAADGQTPPPAKGIKPPKATKVWSIPDPRTQEVPQTERLTSERSIAVDPEASIKLCVLNGRLKINGWERSEIRLFVKDGSRAGIKVLEKNSESGKPVWLLISNRARPDAAGGPISDCISGESIEMDVPMKASLNVSGRTTQITTDSVKKISVKNVEGNIALRNISGGITASTYQGDISIENSGGAISLDSATGNIIAYEVNPGQIGDLFRAKTNSGTISLQRVEHRQIEASSITGSVLFNGKFLAGGLYNFKTSNGAIRLLIPEDSSFTIKAAYGFGIFDSDLPFKVVTENASTAGKNIVVTLGSGDATVNLTTTSGSIGIKKQP